MYKVLKEKNYTETSKINEDQFSELCPALYAMLVDQIKDQDGEEAAEGESKLSQGHGKFLTIFQRITEEPEHYYDCRKHFSLISF